MSPEKLITELSAAEKEWWGETIKVFRGRYISEPKHYSSEILKQKGITVEALKERTDDLIEILREEVWQLYLKDEAIFHAQVLEHLVKERDIPRDILSSIIEQKILTDDYKVLDKEAFVHRIARVVGEYTGLIMPYIYDLSLSTTNSRRARSGKTFEAIIESFMDIFDYPYDNQSSVGTETFSESGLGKKVDLIIPSMDAYARNRAKSAVVTAKTSLRERWQEVAEELQRTNVPHIYLLTADKAVTDNTVGIMSNYNITLVVYSSEKAAKFGKRDNVIDFQTFYTEEMPHIISYWRK